MMFMMIRKNILTSLVVVFTCNSCGEKAAREIEGRLQDRVEQVSDLSIEDIDYGKGYDQITDEIRGSCLEPVEPKTVPKADGMTTQYQLKMVESTKHLAKMLNVSAGASISSLFGSASAKMSLINESETQSNSVYALVVVSALNAPSIFDNAQLTRSAQNLLRTGAKRFREKCGDTFVSSITTGGEYFALIEMHTDSAAEKMDLKTSIEGSMGAWKAQAQMERALRQSSSARQISVSIQQIGGSGVNSAACDSIECIIERSKSFPKIVAENPAVVSFKTSDYRTLDLPRDGQSIVDITAQRITENLIVDTRYDQLDLLKTYRLPQEMERRLTAQKSNHYASGKAKSTRNVNTLNAAAIECFRDVDRCAMPSLETVNPDEFPPDRSHLTPPWTGPGAVRFTGPSNGYFYAFTSDDCIAQDVIHDNDVALAYIQWSLSCRYINKKMASMMMFEPYDGEVRPRETLLYPVYRETRRGEKMQWRPSLKTQFNAQGAVVYDCYAPAQLEWESICVVDSNYERQNEEL